MTGAPASVPRPLHFPRRALAAALAASALAGAPAARAQEPAPPDPVCPAIAEGFEMCSDDLLSGNCPQFVAAAGALANLYQIQVAVTPERTPYFLATNWWGCGDATLLEMKALLARLATPAARAVLAQAPFAGLALAPPGAPAAPTPTTAPDCEAPPTSEGKRECAEAELGAARAAYREALAACRAAVAPGLADQLAGAELAWETSLPAQCAPAAMDYSDPALQDFARSQCLAQALRERTQGMLAAHPECASGR
jgi:uncharacterized protein YecT (DUF1311 family)